MHHEINGVSDKKTGLVRIFLNQEEIIGTDTKNLDQSNLERKDFKYLPLLSEGFFI
jgi:hypothetical protein